VGSTEYAARTCDGNGLCREATSRACSGGGTCAGASCDSSCTTEGDCQTGFFCEGGVCRVKRPIASACTTAAQCASGFCASGFCCSSACTARCFACNLSGTAGTCTAQRSGTLCGTQTCTGSTERAASACNGQGSCVAGATRDCGSYRCSGSACGTSCSGDAQCTTGAVCNAGSCAGAGLIIDDFEDTSVGTNRLGGTLTWDNANCSQSNGQLVCSWSGTRDFLDFIETFRKTWCEYDLRAYSKLQFRMRASAAGKTVKVYFGAGNGSCTLQPLKVLATITLTTTMSTYQVDITGVARDKAMTVEFDPETVDSTQYFLDDLQAVP
jgi:hypothetical protein